MAHLSATDLMSLEQYAKARPAMRAEIMEHKKHRKVHLGPNATLYFEDRRTIQYQIQEMLRIERVFEEAGINDELDAYNPLIPDGSNWKATFMIEYPDVEERRQMLAKLIGIERMTWVRVAGFDKVTPIANEDMERETEEKTSSIHFLRFELTADMVQAVKAGAAVSMGIEHPAYMHVVDTIPADVRLSLAADLA
jgi:hypothetical protein